MILNRIAVNISSKLCFLYFLYFDKMFSKLHFVFQSTFLEPPYGTCGNKPMPLYPDTNYTTSHCLTICDMNSLIDRCGCILPYMSGKILLSCISCSVT